MERDRLRVGAFGIGRMGRVHVENLVRLHLDQRIQLVALGDRHTPTTKASLSLVEHIAGPELTEGLETYECPRSMAELSSLDAVVVSSRIRDHFEDIVAFASNGIPTFVEKPMLETVTQAAELNRLLGDRQTSLVEVGFQRHYDPAAQAAKQWFDSGAIGKLQQSHHVIQDKNPPSADYLSGGLTADMAVHLVFESMSYHDFQLPRFVQAMQFAAPYYEDAAGEGANVLHALLSWQDGSVAHLWGSRLNATGYDNGFKLIGTQGRIDVGEFVGDFGEVVAKLWQGTGEGPMPRGSLTESVVFPMTQPAPYHPDFYPRYAAAFAAEVEAFLKHVQDKTPFDLGTDVAWKTLFATNLAHQSALQTGQRFELTWAGKAIDSAEVGANYMASLGLK